LLADTLLVAALIPPCVLACPLVLGWNRLQLARWARETRGVAQARWSIEGEQLRVCSEGAELSVPVGSIATGWWMEHVSSGGFASNESTDYLVRLRMRDGVGHAWVLAGAAADDPPFKRLAELGKLSARPARGGRVQGGLSSVLFGIGWVVAWAVIAALVMWARS
jgi:hypothetical protein